MNRTIKQLMEEDDVRRKAQWSEDMTYVFYYIFLVVCDSMAVFLGVTTGDEGWSIGIVFFYVIIYSVTMEMYAASLMRVNERGKQVSIFCKYCYVPVSLKHLFWAKLVLIVKKIGLTSMIAQMIAFLIRALSGRGFSYLGALHIPMLLGVVCAISCVVELYVAYRSTANENKR